MMWFSSSCVSSRPLALVSENSSELKFITLALHYLLLISSYKGQALLLTTKESCLDAECILKSARVFDYSANFSGEPGRFPWAAGAPSSGCNITTQPSPLLPT